MNGIVPCVVQNRFRSIDTSQYGDGDMDMVVTALDTKPENFKLIVLQSQLFYVVRTSGLCTDGGGSYIETKEDCDEGAGVLGWLKINAK